MNWFKRKEKVKPPVEKLFEVAPNRAKTNPPKLDVDFSILVPTRGRYSLLIRMLDSVRSKTKDLSNVDIYLMGDDDDFKTVELVADYRKYNPNVTIYLDLQGRNPYNNENYINRAARRSRAKYFWTLGNDCEVLTQDWDVIAKEKIEEFLKDKPDRLCYGLIQDDIPYHNDRGCCFPFITREYLDVTDTFMPKEITCYGADEYLYRIFKYFSSGRMLNMMDIGIIHYSHHSGRIHQDEISLNMYGPKHKSWLLDHEYMFYVNSCNEWIKVNEQS